MAEPADGDTAHTGSHAEPAQKGEPPRALASFLGPLVPVDLTPAPDEFAGRAAVRSRFGTAAAPKLIELPGFRLPRQVTDDWCWAAIDVALQEYLNLPTVFTQCKLAQRVHAPGVDCCRRTDHPDCDRVAHMSDVLATLSIERRTSPEQPTTPIEGAAIRRDIAHRKLVICLMRRFDGGIRHFMVIVGVDQAEGEDWVGFDDPGSGSRYWRPLRVFGDNFDGWRWEQATRLA